MVIQLGRRAHLLDAPLVHDHYAIRHFERLFLSVSDEEAGDVDLVMQPAEPAAEVFPHLGVERPERLVQQEDLRLHRQRAGEGNALLLPARELRGIAVGQRFELHQPQQFQHALADIRLGRPLRARAHAEAKGDVLEHAEVAE